MDFDVSDRPCAQVSSARPKADLIVDDLEDGVDSRVEIFWEADNPADPYH